LAVFDCEAQTWISLDAFGVEPHPARSDFVRDPSVYELQRDVLGTIGEQMQLDAGVLGGGPRQYGSDQTRLKL